MNDKWTGELAADQEDMLKRVASAAAGRVTRIEIHSIGALLSMSFGIGTIQSRIFARHVNLIRRGLGLPQITQAAAGDPTMEEKMQILRSAVEKLGDEAQAILIQVLLRSPMYQSAERSACGEKDHAPPDS